MKFPLPPFGPEVCLTKYGKSPYLFYASSAEPMTSKELKALEDESIADMWENLVLGYAPTNGHPLLIAEIASLYGSSIGSENVLCFPGAQTAIFALLASLLEEKDHCVIVCPCYPSLENIPAAICKTTRVYLKLENRWELDLNEIKDAITPNTKVIVLNSPNNPTGSLISEKTQIELVEIARKNGIWIFSDEVYRLLELDLKHRLTPMADLYEKGISLGVMSKAYGLGGLSIGWLVSRNKEVLKKCSNLRHYLSVSNAAGAEIQAIVALRSGDKITSIRRKIILDNMQILDSFFKEYEKWFEWVRPKSGCVAFVKFKGSISVDNLAQELIDQSGVLVMPASALNFPGNFFRIGFGRKNMPASLEKLVDFTNRNSKNW